MKRSQICLQKVVPNAEEFAITARSAFRDPHKVKITEIFALD